MYSTLNTKKILFNKLILKPTTIFMISTMVVNGGNYLYNLWLGRKLGPAAFSEAGLLLTFLLILSFAGMTFQLVASKFIIDLESNLIQAFTNWIKKRSIEAGLITMGLLMVFAKSISSFFYLQNHWAVIVFSFSIPLYFLLSSERGLMQGSHSFIKLSGSYQIEIWFKFLATVLFLYLFSDQVGLAIALSMLISILISQYFRKSEFKVEFSSHKKLPKPILKKVLQFASFTLGYELIQIIINYGDMLMVKHYFDATTAGLYTSMALIGRMIYFVTWMMVMVLIPTILQKRKDGLTHRKTMFGYLAIISAIAGSVVIFSFLFPEFTITILFGNEFISFAPLLWKYALATTLFALANLFIYYFISTEYYFPVYACALLTILQLGLFIMFHESISQIVEIQIGMMAVLLGIQLLIFLMKREAKS